MFQYRSPVTPAELSPALHALIDSLRPGTEPVYVDVKPREGTHPDAPFAAVDEQVREQGGERVAGWVLRVLPGLFAEAEFYAVWRDPQGSLIDVTPKRRPSARVLFLADPSRPVDGRQVSNLRRPLAADPLVEAYLASFDRMFALMTRGERALQRGPIELEGAEADEARAIQQDQVQLFSQLASRIPAAGPYQPCPCGSGKKVRWCPH